MTEELPNLDLVFTEVKEQLAVQLKQVDSLDTKTGLILGFGSLIVTTVMSIKATVTSRGNISLGLLVLAVFTYALIIWYSCLAYKIREYRKDPNPENLYQKYVKEKSYSLNFTKELLVLNCLESFKWNKKIIEDKARYHNLAFAYLVFELVVLSVLIIFY